jgi:hypothetical protein
MRKTKAYNEAVLEKGKRNRQQQRSAVNFSETQGYVLQQGSLEIGPQTGCREALSFYRNFTLEFLGPISLNIKLNPSILSPALL